MLADEDEEIRNEAVLQVLAIMKTKYKKDVCGQSEESLTKLSASDTYSFIPRFFILSANFEGACYYDMINILSASTQESVLTQNFSDIDIAKIQHSHLVCLHAYHDQVVERHIEVVTEASAVECGIKRREVLLVNS